ncbi:hypothetical protein OIE66_01325 [Nonomuraea sp. NBC_01738]|uniref:hypothetical protein n=1 Tax=Nonomuraea sp. NBC_01738 TaxID=2976003 RepID=UPI002E0F0573|nr:hypothetical protein OIE66_01325 [Nonomuraea sp. NBC_01738]
MPVQPLPALHRLLSLAATVEKSLPLRLSPSPEALHLRELAEHSLHALRRDGHLLTITEEGRRLLDSPTTMWEAATGLLLGGGGHEFDVSVRETALMLLADGSVMSPAELRSRVAEIVGGEGWHPATGRDDIAHPLAALVGRLTALDLAFGDDFAVRLTPTGHLAALTALRAHALRPRQYVSS